VCVCVSPAAHPWGSHILPCKLCHSLAPHSPHHSPPPPHFLLPVLPISRAAFAGSRRHKVVAAATAEASGVASSARGSGSSTSGTSGTSGSVGGSASGSGAGIGGGAGAGTTPVSVSATGRLSPGSIARGGAWLGLGRPSWVRLPSSLADLEQIVWVVWMGSVVALTGLCYYAFAWTFYLVL
jgi:hypothetical protein